MFRVASRGVRSRNLAPFGDVTSTEVCRVDSDFDGPGKDKVAISSCSMICPCLTRFPGLLKSYWE